MEVSKLESLPAEIRTRIYKFLFLSQEVHLHDPNPASSFPCTDRRSTPNSLAILRTSKLTKSDAEPQFYAVAIITPCPCFLSRTETYDFEAKVNPQARSLLQPVLKLWELRRTTQVFNHSFTFFSGLQQFAFTYSQPGWHHALPWPGGESLSIAYLIAHTQKWQLTTWIRMPLPESLPTEPGWIWLKVGSPDTITILAENQTQARHVKEYLLGLKHWITLSGEDFAARLEFVLSSTKFDVIIVDSFRDDWLYRYHYECCMEGQNTAVKGLGLGKRV